MSDQDRVEAIGHLFDELDGLSWRIDVKMVGELRHEHYNLDDVDAAERAICRAAAEISGLTPYSAGQSANFITGTTWMSEERDAAIGGLRRFAQLAAEDE